MMFVCLYTPSLTACLLVANLGFAFEQSKGRKYGAYLFDSHSLYSSKNESITFAERHNKKHKITAHDGGLVVARLKNNQKFEENSRDFSFFTN